MATDNQLADLQSKLRKYRSKYLRKEFSNVGEAATRIMTNAFLTDVLGYKELSEIKTEFRIRGEYADYVIQVGRKKHFVVEVKSIDLDLSHKHLRQSLSYAANEGIEWILLLNGREIQLYRVSFGKPIDTSLIYKIDLLDKEDFKKAPGQIWYLTKKSVEKNELKEFWKRTDALLPENLAKVLFSEDVIRRLRNDLKNETDIWFQLDDVAHALHHLVINAVEFPRPKIRKNKK